MTFCSQVNSKHNSIQTYNQVAHPLKPYQQLVYQSIAGYSDGTVRKFDFGLMEMLYKVKAHTDAVTDIMCALDGTLFSLGQIDMTPTHG